MLVPPGNAEALAQAVRKIATMPATEKLLRSEARHAYERQYRPEANAQSLFEIYREVL